MFYEDRSIDFSVCSENTRDIWAQYSWGFPLYRPILLGIPTLPPAGRKNVAFQRFNRHRKLNFRCRRDKKNIWTQQKNVCRSYETFSVFYINFNISYYSKKFIFSSFQFQFTIILILIFTKSFVGSIDNLLVSSNIFSALKSNYVN